MVAESLLMAVPEEKQHSCLAWTCWACPAWCSCPADMVAVSEEWSEQVQHDAAG